VNKLGNLYFCTAVKGEMIIKSFVCLFHRFNLPEKSYCQYCKFSIHVKWVPCHHGMARPQVGDGGDGLQILKVDANILNKPSQTAGK
jgi:hypothetical protein